MQKHAIIFGICAVLVAGCDMSPNPRIAAVGPTEPSIGGVGNRHSALVIQPSQVDLFVGATFQLTTNAPGTPLTWRTTNPAIAGISATGLVSGMSAGIATITATASADPSQTASATVIVRSR
jgi:Big-like domain-containing protein